ncbi:MAG: 50S ribosomal protein L10 [Gemmatimonadetes bacterium]|nr:50S ribosomal protein L10 [Gemmatimonadota bacterium]
MKRTNKESFVADFQERIRSAPVLYLMDFSGLDVKSVTRLRRRLGESGAEYVVVKNRLARRALEGLDSGLPDLAEHLKGPTGVVIADRGPVESAKALSEFAKEHNNRPVFKVGVVDRKLVEAGQFQKLAKLPPRDVLLAQLAGALEAPLSAFVAMLSAKLQETAGLLEVFRERQQAEGK